MATAPQIQKLRELTGVDSTQYELDGTTYWTDAQLEDVLDANTAEVTTEEPDPQPDMNASVADVLEAWTAQLSLAYDISIDGQSMARSQMAAAVKKRAAEYRDKAVGGGIRTIEAEAPW